MCLEFCASNYLGLIFSQINLWRPVLAVFEELDRPAAACHNMYYISHPQNGRTTEYQCTWVMISQMEGEIQPC